MFVEKRNSTDPTRWRKLRYYYSLLLRDTNIYFGHTGWYIENETSVNLENKYVDKIDFNM